jgi:hypothetical protein
MALDLTRARLPGDRTPLAVPPVRMRPRGPGAGCPPPGGRGRGYAVARDWPGMAAMSWRVYSSRGAWKISSGPPLSTTFPSRMTYT